MGFTLIELMVALVIGAILTAGLLEIFIGGKKTYQVQQALSRIQENGRFALEFLNRDIRMAGAMGCLKVAWNPAGNLPMNLTNTLDSTALPYNFLVAIEGFDGASALPPYLTSQLGTQPTTGTDIIVVRSIVGAPARVVANNDAEAVFTEVSQNFDSGDLLALSDCAKARVFQAGDIATHEGIRTITHPASGVPGNDPAIWGGAGETGDFRFGADAEVYRVQTRLYYIRPNPNQVPALYQKADANVPRELIEGVQDMQILYGVAESPGVVSQYLKADQVTAAAAWPRVVSVRVNLLLQSANNRLADAPQPYAFNGVTVTPSGDDLRLRRIFATTVAIRNRVL